MTRIPNLTEETSPANDDLLLLAKASDGTWRKVQVTNLGGGGSGGSVAWADVTGKPTVFPTAFSFCQVRNTSTANINTAAANISFGGTTDATDADYTLAADSITVNFDGVVNVQALITQTTGSARTNVGVWITKNNARVSGIGQSGYIRAASGHNQSSSHVNATFTVSDGDVIRVRGEQRGGGGTVNQIAGESQVTVERRV